MVPTACRSPPTAWRRWCRPPSAADRRGRRAAGQADLATRCTSPAGEEAFTKLVTKLRDAAGLDLSVQTAVLASPCPMLLRCRRQGVLFDSCSPRPTAHEIAGVIAHEFGHLKHATTCAA
jgi:hypothetical protein